MIEKRGASLFFLAAGLTLLLAYLVISHVMYRFSPSRSEWAAAISVFFSPGYKNAPGQWLLAELIKFGMAAAGLVCLGVAAVPRGAWAASIRSAASIRVYWRTWIWAVLLGSTGIGLVFILLDLVAPSGLERRGGLWQWVAYGSNVIRVICGALICARLLFARERRPYERWLGYIFAALSLYDLAWSLLRVLDLDFAVLVLAERNRDSSILSRLGSESFGIAFACAAAWTGLFIARRRGTLQAQPVAAPEAVYLCSAGLLFFLGFTRVFGIWRIVGDMGPTALGYGAAALAYLGLTFLASLHSARLAVADQRADAIPVPPRDGAWRKHLLVQTPIGLAVSLALMGVGYLLVNKIPLLTAAFLLPLVMLLLFGGPILVFIYGILRGRIGYSLGAVILALGLSGYRSYNLHQASQRAKVAVAQAETLNIYPFKPARQTHDIVALVDTYLGQMDHAGCSERCRLVLLGSPYAVAVERKEKQVWSVLRLVHDRATCRAEANRASMLDFLAAGEADACVVPSEEPPRADALIIRENQSSDAAVTRLFPKGFRGSAFEFLERIDGKDELLGRIVWGGVQPPLFSDQKGERLSYALDEKGFYAAALNLPGPTPPPITVAQAQAAIAVYLELWTEKLDGGFHNSWVGFLAAAKEPAATEAVKATILDQLLSENPARTRFGLQSLFSFRAGDPAFVKQALASLVTSDRLHGLTEKPSNLPSLLQEVRGAFPEPQRQAARAALLRPGVKHADELLALLGVLGHGGAAERSETAALILGLPQEDFQRAVASMGDHDRNQVVIEPPLINFWSETQIAELARRAPDVPDLLLADYVEAMRWTPGFVKVRGEIKDLLQKRLAAGIEDERLRSRLQIVESHL
ncbi:hypothetical protein [Dongia sp.]|uniref:hypothetical protein n=1 Tax=Dongia sp. TaxID=1977262 RepID=UPI003751B6F6